MLDTYLTQVGYLLTNSAFWSQSELTGYINEARNRIASDTKCLRQLVTSLVLEAEQETYVPQTFLGAVGPYLVDVIGITIYWGNQRIKLSRYGFSKFDTFWRQQSQYYSRPAAFSRQGSNTIFISPVPDQSYISDWDVAIVPDALESDSDPEQIPVPFQEPVQYYAAYKAKLKEQAQGEAQMFLAYFNQMLARCARNYSTFVVHEPYARRL